MFIVLLLTTSSLLTLISSFKSKDPDLSAIYIADENSIDKTSTTTTTLLENYISPLLNDEVQVLVPEVPLIVSEESENTFIEIESNEIFNKTVQIIAEDCFVYDFNDNYTTSLGSGVLISESGYIITNAHVLEDCEGDLFVATINNVDDITKINYEAKLIKYDLELDLALIRITNVVDGGLVENNFNHLVWFDQQI